jgi:heme exporter protein B
MKTPFLTTALAIISKDLRAEMRSRELVSVMVLFAFLSILIFSFALELDRVAREEAVSGVLWVTLIFASILGFNRSMAMERDQGNIDAMLLAPIDRSAIFVGKLVGNYLFTLIVGLVMLPVMTILYNKTMLEGWVILTVILGIFGFSTIGTLLATMTVQTRAREALLPIAMLPVVLPFLLTAVRATTNILNGSPQSEWMMWVQLLGGISLLYLVLCVFLYGYVVEE